MVDHRRRSSAKAPGLAAMAASIAALSFLSYIAFYFNAKVAPLHATEISSPLLSPDPPRRADLAPLKPRPVAATYSADAVRVANALGRQSRVRAKGKLYSLGDLHGDYEGLVYVLRDSLGLIDDRLDWAGGDAVLVQTGDVTDRGEDSASIMRLLQRLRIQAPLSNGRVVLLMGNHELIQLASDWRFVSRRENLGYGDGSIAQRREAFSLRGEFGEFVRHLPLAVVVEHGANNRVLFVHGGLEAKILKRFLQKGGGALEALNDYALDLLRSADTERMESLAYEESIFTDRGPMWSRMFAMHRDESFVCASLRETLKLVDADKMVVGHTVQQNFRVNTRCGGKLIMGDVGFSPYYGGPRIAVEHFDNQTGFATLQL